MSDLAKLAKELSETQKLASMDPEAVSWQARASVTAMVRDARERAEKLKVQYLRVVRANTLGIFLVGDAARVSAFASIANQEAGTFVVDGSQLYKRLAAKVQASIGSSREFGPTQLEGVIAGLREIAPELGIREMEMPRLTRLGVVKDEAELVAHVRNLIRDTFSDDLLRVYIDAQVNKLAVDSGFTGTVFPVAISGVEPEEVAAVAAIFTTSHTVEAGTTDDGEVTKDFVLKQLQTLKKKMKGPKGS